MYEGGGMPMQGDWIVIRKIQDIISQIFSQTGSRCCNCCQKNENSL
ncbi:hypothetical protein [Desulforamulus aeronauticus]